MVFVVLGVPMLSCLNHDALCEAFAKGFLCLVVAVIGAFRNSDEFDLRPLTGSEIQDVHCRFLIASAAIVGLFKA